MRQILLTITLLSILAILPMAIFAQNSADMDGDGVPDSEDVCPRDKGTKANKGCPGKDESTLTPTSVPIKVSDDPALADCQSIIEDEGCKKFYGKSAEELRSIFGQLPQNGSYRKLGIWFYLWSSSTATTETVAEVTFYGTDFGEVKRFYGNPGKNIDWNASRADVIKYYGDPAEEATWELSNGEKGLALYYNGKNLRIEFTNEKLTKITIRYPKHNDEVAAKLEKRKKEYEAEQEATNRRLKSEKAKSGASQMESDYNALLDQLDAKIREGERIIKQNMTLIAMGGQWAKDVRNKLDKVAAAGDSLIDRFGKKYDGKIPVWMVNGIKEKWRPVPFPQ